jgi:hypothetical protein
VYTALIHACSQAILAAPPGNRRVQLVLLERAQGALAEARICYSLSTKWPCICPGTRALLPPPKTGAPHHWNMCSPLLSPVQLQQ